MTGLRAEVKYLQATMVSSDASPLLVKEKGCCPGNKVEAQIKYAYLITNLNQDINGIIHNYEALDSDLQEMSKLTKSMDERFSPSLKTGVQQAATITILEESVHQVWALQPSAKSEAEFTSKIHVLNSNSQDSSNGSANIGVSPNYMPSFKQVFDPKISTIAFLLAIYETVMS
ncbi:hypothetical protein DSO57_1023585 [Entomophthora muscae]|uniref:Uncharacterized protein n=1 Tax=Entomophthora muscae TaxID=34485 RepID=A0ACC2U0N9_9FUNG|nr:hypothetical protein DSO57_1023585 [Entomophthora muscae]